MYDLAVIGSGTAGLSAAQAAAAMGGSVLLVEGNRLGGECTWNGCVPSKALIEAANLRHSIDRAHLFGIRVQPPVVDFAAVMAHVRNRVETIAAHDSRAHLEALGVAVRRGHARLDRAGSMTVDGEPVAARSIVLCSGSRPLIPPIEGLSAGPHLTNETLFDLENQPSKLVILGAGPIGLEMAQAFARLGTDVEVVDMVPTLLPHEDPDIAALTRSILEGEGVRFVLGACIAAVRHGASLVQIDLSVNGDRRTVSGDAVLVAMGRRAEVDSLGLEHAGVRVGARGVVVDEYLRTTAEGIYAAGDITGIHPFTHVAAYQGRIAASNALGKQRQADHRVVPWVIFTDPEIAHVGLTEPEARETHRHVRTVTLPFSAIDRAIIKRLPHGIIKVITGHRTQVGPGGGGALLGAHIMGPGAGELIHEFALAMQARTFAGRLAHTIHAYPTMALGVQQAVGQLFAKGRTTAGDWHPELDSET